MKEHGNIPTNRFSRAAKTGLVATKIGAKQLTHLGKKTLKGSSFTQSEQEEHEEELGKILIQALGMLRGTALKLSQALSQEADLLPESMRKELSKACHKVIPLSRALVQKVFLKEWGVGPDDVFQSFESNAFAAASLGQVHRATSKSGENLAVKVQYPGIAATISSDLAMMRTLLVDIGGRSKMLPRRDLLATVLDEVEERLLEEVDYRNEAENLEWFRERVTIPNIVIPNVFPAGSGDRVLAMECLHGCHFEDWLAKEPSQQERNLVGQHLFDFLVHCFFDLKCLHADPHQGNYLVLENGDLGVLDFGCVKRIGDDFPAGISRIMGALVANRDGQNSMGVLDAYKAIGLFSESYTLEQYIETAHSTLKPIQDWLCLPYFESHYDFSKHPRMPQASFKSGRTAMKDIVSFNGDYVFFDRSYNGVVNILYRIGAQVDTSSMIRGV